MRKRAFGKDVSLAVKQPFMCAQGQRVKGRQKAMHLGLSLFCADLGLLALFDPFDVFTVAPKYQQRQKNT